MWGTEGWPNTQLGLQAKNIRTRVTQDYYYCEVSLQNTTFYSSNLQEVCPQIFHAITKELQSE